MSNLNVTERRKNTVLILDLDGKLKLGEDCSNLRQRLRLLAENGEKKVLLNMANVSYIDSSGLGELVAGYITFQKNKGEVRLVNLSEGVYELMVLTKLLTVFEVYEDEKTAVESFGNPSFRATHAGDLS